MIVSPRLYLFILWLSLFFPLSIAAQTTETKNISLPQDTKVSDKSTSDIPLSTSPTTSIPLNSSQVKDDDHLPFMRQEESRESTNGLWLMARTLGALALILGLLVVAMWTLKRVGNTAWGKAVEASPLTVITTVSLGEKRTLTVVRFNGRMLLVGATTQAITLLATDSASNTAETTSLRSVADVLSTGEVELFDHELAKAKDLQALEHGLPPAPVKGSY